MKKLIPLALIIILGFSVYANSLKGDFLWDDNLLIEGNKHIKNLDHVLNLFGEDIGAGVARKSASYRPLQMLTYALDYSFWKLNPLGYHLGNIILHILVALCIYWLINLLFGDKILALLTGILFVIHPIQTEAVSYISGRADPLACLFMLLCFIFYIKLSYQASLKYYVFMILSCAFALLARENSLILPALLLVYQYVFRKKIKLREFLPVLFISIIYIILRLTVLRELLSRVVYPTTVLERLPGVFAAIAEYIKLLVLPFNLHMEYGNRLFSFTAPPVLVGIAVFCVAIIYIFKQREKNKLAVFSLLWFFTGLLPSSNIFPVGAYMAEHWLYLASIGFFLFISKGLTVLYCKNKFRIVAIFLAVSLSGFYSYLTIKQNDYWRKPLIFYQTTLKYAPDSPRLVNDLGLAYYGIGRGEEAVKLFKRAIEIKPDFVDSYVNLGAAFVDFGRIQEAIALYNKALWLNPVYPEAIYNNLGFAYSKMGKYEDALVFYNKAISENPTFEKIYLNLGLTYHELGNYQEAIASYKKALAINPEFLEAYVNLGVAYQDIDQYQDAIVAYKHALSLNLNHEVIYNNLGFAYSKLGKYQDAVNFYKKALSLNPNFETVLINLGVLYNDLARLYYGQKQFSLAVEYCDKAIELGYKVSPEFLELLEPFRKK